MCTLDRKFLSRSIIASIMVCLLVYPIICFSTSSSDIKAVEVNDELIIGCWNGAPRLGGGFADCHNFYEDGSYRLNYNQSDTLKRRLYLDGYWELTNDALIVSLTSQAILVGGDIEYLAGYGHRIVGGETILEIIDPPRVITYALENMKTHYAHDETYGSILSFWITNCQFWKLADNPTE